MFDAKTKEDEVVKTSKLYKTTDYAKFKTIAGNRKEDRFHTTRLANKIKNEGNLTDLFPVIVNERMEIIDGLHRTRALQRLGLPVYYEIKEGANVDTVISKNTGQKNWTWLDYAESWAERGNQDYGQFIELASIYNDRFRVLCIYSGFGRKSDSFKEGGFVMKDFDLARKHLHQYHELVDASKVNNTQFAEASYKYMRTPKYDHSRMLRKITAYGNRLALCYTMYDYLSALDEIWRAGDEL